MLLKYACRTLPACVCADHHWLTGVCLCGQGKLTLLQRAHEKTEQDLYDSQMLAAQLETELVDDDGDSDNLFRER